MGREIFEVISFFFFFLKYFETFSIFDFSVKIIFDCCITFFYYLKSIYIYNICVQIMIFEEQDKVNFISLIVYNFIYYFLQSALTGKFNF